MVPHPCEFLQQAVNIPQVNRQTSSDRFIKHGEIADFEKLQVFQTFLPTSDSEFRAALGHILDLVWFTRDGKVF